MKFKIFSAGFELSTLGSESEGTVVIHLSQF